MINIVFRGCFYPPNLNENLYDLGLGGTELVVLDIAKMLSSRNYKVFIVSNVENEFIGKSGINYVKNINEKNFNVIIDVRVFYSNFIPNVKYIHWIHDDCDKKAKVAKYTDIKRYDKVISLTALHKSQWDRHINTFNFTVINNPFILESISKKESYNKYKIVAVSSKTDWHKALKIIEELRKIDNRFELHICSPGYCNISKMLNSYSFVKNHGALSHNKTMELLSDAFVCLYPTTFGETFGLVCYECMYYGVPMLTEYVNDSNVNEIIPNDLILPRNCSINNYTDIILKWYYNLRPKLSWNHQNAEIYNQWEQLVN